MRTKNRPVTPEERKEMRRLYAEGKTLTEIGKRLNRNKYVVSYSVSKFTVMKRLSYGYCYYRLNKCGGFKNDMKMVVFRRNGYLYMTNENNYNAIIENAHETTSLKDFDSFEQVVDYMVKYTGVSRDKFIDMTGDKR